MLPFQSLVAGRTPTVILGQIGGRRRSIVDVEGGGRAGGDASDTRDEDGRGGTTPHADCAWEEDWPF